LRNQTSANAMRGNGHLRRAVGRFLGAYGLLLMLAVLFVVFAIVNQNFLSLQNFKALLEQNSVLAIVAVGMTFALISRNIDLAPGSIIVLSSVVLGLVFTASGNIWLGIACGVAAAIAVDLFDGFLIGKAGIDPLIVTLAAWIWVRGLAISLTKANSIVIRDPVIDFMNNAQFLGISPPIVLILVAFAFGWFILNRTRLGRYTYALGGDERAAIQAGIDTVAYKIMMFGMLGIFAAVGMVVTVSRLGAAAPDATYGLELDAIVSVIIGGNPFTGGEGSLRKTLFGVLFIAVLNNGLSTLGMRDAYFYAYKGLTILVALFFDVISRRLLRGAEPVTAVAEFAAPS
jgi:ribose/xylose/arabinose/galactoside ABC-type transport system permease subunit